SGLNAEYGQARGSVINVVTQSGGNKFSGSASVYYSPDALGADLPKGIETPGYHFRSSSEYGLTLGGPIIKDKLWFFAAGNIVLRYTDYSLQERLDFSPYIRFNYKPDSTNQFQLSYNYARNRYEQKETSSYYRSDETDVLPRQMVSGSWDRDCSDGWETHFQTSYTQFNQEIEDSHNYSDTSGGVSSSRFGLAKDKSAKSFDVYFNAVAPLFFCGSCSHQLGMGIGYQATSLHKTVGQFGWFSFTIPDYQYNRTEEYSTNMDHRAHMTDWSVYIQDTWTPFDQLTVNAGTRFDRETFTWGGDSAGDQEIHDESVFAWSLISPRIGLTYDITGDGKNVARLSAGRYYQSGQYGWFEEAHPAGATDYDRKTVKDGTTIIDTTTVSHIPPSSTVGYDGYDLKAPYMDEIMFGVKRQMSEDWSLGIRYIKRWERNLIQTVDASRLNMDALINNNKLEWHGYQPVDITNPYNNQHMTVYQDTHPKTPHVYTIVNPPGAERNYDALELTFNKTYSHGWSLNASYVYSRSRGMVSTSDYDENYGLSDLYQNPNAQINAEGLFTYAFPHQIKVYGVADGPYDIQIGYSARIFSGNPYTKSLSSAYPPLNELPDGYGTIYAEKRGDSRLPTFWMLNLGLEKTLKVSDTITTTLFVDGYNITNNEIQMQVYPIIGSETEGELQLLRILNPGLFQFGVRVDF
ncbi:TonB-dependent receptor, partial [bacterium]|nr:TonB-dependent receptor [bacterium]